MSSKKKSTKKFLTTLATTKKPTKPDLKMIKSNYPNDSSSQRSKHFSKLALDSLSSKNKKSPQVASGKIADPNDYLERLNDNQAHSEQDDYSEYDDDDDDEGSIHQIDSGTDPNVLLQNLTKSKNHELISHFSNSHSNPIITRKPTPSQQNPIEEDDNNRPPMPLPGPPKAVQAVYVRPRFITLNWLEPEENPDEVVSYTVYYSMLGTDARYEL
jgi:hypothetical protein